MPDGPSKTRFLPAFPYPHYLGLAPLDVWCRLIVQGTGPIQPRYWLRLVVAIGLSCLATAITLPERLALALPRWLARCRGFRHDPGVLIVLGYYRTGTTNLHYLLSRDPASWTPRWPQVLLPRGGLLSWTLFRWLMTPFMGSKRPQDDVGFGPTYPAEEDFALCNAALASSLVARQGFPSRWDYYERFHDLERLSPAELGRWRRAALAISRTYAAVAGSRRLVLKTPSSTARVRELLDLYGRGLVKFIHISRPADATLKSNVTLLRRLDRYNFQTSPDDAVNRERVIAEYDRTERAYLRDRGLIPAGDLVEVRFEDLAADAVGELRRIYQSLSLAWTSRFERRAEEYVASLGEYRPAHQPGLPPPELEWMARAFGHDRPACERAVPDPEAERRIRPRLLAGIAAGAIAAASVLAVWLALVWILDRRLDWMIWPASIAVGAGARAAAGRGCVTLARLAALAILVLLPVAVHLTSGLISYDDPVPRTFAGLWPFTRHELLEPESFIWGVIAILTAYREAGRAR